MVATAALLLLVLLWWRGLLVALGRIALLLFTRHQLFVFCFFVFARTESNKREDVPEEDRSRVVEEGSSRLGEGDCFDD